MTGDGAVLRIAVVAATGTPTLDGDAVRAAIRTIGTAGPEARVILLSHPGKDFCLGGDVAAFGAAVDPAALVAELAAALHTLVRALADSPLPVVAAVPGWAVGAGMSLAALADITVIGAGTRFRAAYPGIGFTPDGGMSWTLPRSVGRARALDIMLTNRVVTADEALAIGLAARLVADLDLPAEAETLADQLALASSASLAGVKRLVRDGLGADLGSHLDAEAASITAAAGSAQGREGVRAFLERRPPRFS